MNSRPPPPQGAPPSYAFVTRVYRRSLRPVVIATCFIGALWSLVWGIASLRDISFDRDHVPKLVPFDIVLGVLYLTVCANQVFGVVAAYTRKVPLVRLFAFAQLGAALIILATAIIRVVLHFVFKNELIDECTSLATGNRITTRYGFWGPTTTTILDGEDARRFCDRAWSRASSSEIVWLFIASILAFLFASIAYSFYRQLLDPTSPANIDRRPNAANGPAPARYAPAYVGAEGAHGWQYGQQYGGYGGYGQGQYAPPRGPPPMPAYDGAKLPEYEGNGVERPDKPKDPFGDDESDERGEGSRNRV